MEDISKQSKSQDKGGSDEKDLIPIIYKVACQHYHCSDGDDKQYPDCKEKNNTLVCPALKLIDVYEEIEREKIEIKKKKVR